MIIILWVILALFIASWYAGFIVLWVRGTKKKSVPMVLIGATLTLYILGIVIGIIQVTSWGAKSHHHNKVNVDKQKLDLEKQKLELEKQRLDLEKQKSTQENKLD